MSDYILEIVVGIVFIIGCVHEKRVTWFDVMVLVCGGASFGVGLHEILAPFVGN